MKSTTRLISKLNRYGTYGFFCGLISAQLAMANTTDKADRTLLNAKKSARAMKYDAKKAGRKVTGNDNAWDNTKDSVNETADNLRDEGRHTKRKMERKSE